MTTQPKTKTMDYSNSAENLTNPDRVKELLGRLKENNSKLVLLREQAEALIPENLQEDIRCMSELVNNLTQDIRQAVDESGSFQDLENGLYGIKQRKVSKSYDPASFKTAYPQFAPAVIVETINATALSGLIKGQLITEENLKTTGVLKETVSYAYIIKT
jgi:hypothetical protein